MRRLFSQVDVFGLHAYGGNPVAVILDGDGLDAAQMQAIARWTNLSETTFVLPPVQAGAHYRLRIFTPRQELPFAGHPSIGTAHALLDAGRIRPDAEGRLLQECGAGLVPLQVEVDEGSRRLHVRMPTPQLQPLDPAAQARLTAALGALCTPASTVNVGPTWIVATLADGDRVRALTPDFTALSELSVDLRAVGITVCGQDRSGEADLVVRSFVPADGIPEDPVCGSGNGAVGAYLHALGQSPGPRYSVSQGRECGHDGRVDVRLGHDGNVWVGGTALTCIEGHIEA